MKCLNCGKEHREGDNFCPYCGTAAQSAPVLRSDWTDEAIVDAWRNRKPPVLFVQSIDGMDQYPDLPFDFKKCPTIFYPYSNSYRYMISEENQQEAGKAILWLNTILELKHKQDPSFPFSPLTKEHLLFYPSEPHGLEGDDYSCFEINPFTKTGKKTKFPVTINVHTLSYDADWSASQSDQVRTHGKIFYSSDGKIGRVELHCWKGQEYFPVSWTAKSGLQ